MPSLVQPLRDALFCPSDDREFDSLETQTDDCDRGVRQLARILLQSEEAGIVGRAIDRVSEFRELGSMQAIANHVGPAMLEVGPLVIVRDEPADGATGDRDR